MSPDGVWGMEEVTRTRAWGNVSTNGLGGCGRGRHPHITPTHPPRTYTHACKEHTHVWGAAFSCLRLKLADMVLI